MNLDLDPAQRQLVDAVRAVAATTPAAASGWEVFDALGLTSLLTPATGGRPGIGLFEWCLVLEELGADGRDFEVIRSVRMFLDAFVHVQTAATSPSAAAAFLGWAGRSRAAPSMSLLTWQRTRTGELVLNPPEKTLPEVTLDGAEADRMTDRDLLACGAYAIGIGRRCLELAQDRARDRRRGRRRLAEYQGVSHRLAEAALELSVARIGVWRAAWGEDAGRPSGHLAPAVAAGSVTSVLACAHAAVQTFGAAGTSDPAIVGLYRAAYGIPEICGSAQSLWRQAGSRRPWDPDPMLVADHRKPGGKRGEPAVR